MMLNIRVIFTKKGRAKYIGHLDVSRLMQRALKRAGLPVWYTEGFNPHMYVTFALPLPLGYESESEIMDLRLTEPIPFGEVKDRLNAVLPEGIYVLSVAEPVHKAAQIVCADYEIRLFPENGSPEELLKQWNRFTTQESIPVVKRTKKGPKTVDIKPDIQQLNATASGEELKLTLRLPAGLSKTINPTLVLENFVPFCGEACFFTVNRTRLYCEHAEAFR